MKRIREKKEKGQEDHFIAKKTFTNILYLVLDIVFIVLGIWMSYFLKFDKFIIWGSSEYSDAIYFLMFFVFAILICNIIFDCYSSFFKSIGIVDAVKYLFSFICALILILIIVKSQTLMDKSVPTSFILMCTICIYILMGIPRFSYRILKRVYIMTNDFIFYRRKKKIVLFGTLQSCKNSVELMSRDININKIVVALFVTDQPNFTNKLNGIQVRRASILEICSYIRDKKINQIVVCTDDISKGEIMTMFSACKEYKCEMLKYSHIENYENEKQNTANFSQFEIEDVLGRVAKDLNTEQIRKFIEDKVVLVTGGAGSIGSELCKQVLELGCAQLVLLDINENGLFYINDELLKSFPENRFKIVLASVRDYVKIEKVFNKYRPDLVIHAAAHKHVPLMEENAGEAIKNNVFGTKNVAELAGKYKCKKFLLISSDKAVNPTNVMGATKRIAELIILEQNSITTNTEYVAVRFGNVLGSNGSVVHTFKKQIEDGGPITVTHPDMERFFMTIKEAVSLVLTAGSIAEGGEIFVLDMGEPVKIKRLAEDMIRLSGLMPNEDVKIAYTGLRPGEKMYEELNLDDEKTDKTNFQKIRVLNIKSHVPDLEKKLKELNALTIATEHVNYRRAIHDIVEEYTGDYS